MLLSCCKQETLNLATVHRCQSYHHSTMPPDPANDMWRATQRPSFQQQEVQHITGGATHHITASRSLLGGTTTGTMAVQGIQHWQRHHDHVVRKFPIPANTTAEEPTASPQPQGTMAMPP